MADYHRVEDPAQEHERPRSASVCFRDGQQKDMCQISMAAFLLAVWLVHHIRTVDTETWSDGTEYLDAAGIALSMVACGVCAGGFYYLVWALLPSAGRRGMKLLRRKHSIVLVDEFTEKHCHDHAGVAPLAFHPHFQLGQDHLRMYHFDWTRAAKAMALLGKMALNMYFIVGTFLKLPPRDPLERLNEAKYIVSLYEVFTLGVAVLKFMFFTFSIGLAYMDFISDIEGDVHPYFSEASSFFGNMVSSWLVDAQDIASFTAIKLLINANVDASMPAAASAQKWVFEPAKQRYGEKVGLLAGACAAMAALGTCVLSGGIGAMSLVVKINQVSFITTDTLSIDLLWKRPGDCVTLLGFVVAIAGLSDVPTVKKQAMFAVAVTGEDKKDMGRAIERIQSLVCASMFSKHSFVQAMTLAMTLDADMYQEALFSPASADLETGVVHTDKQVSSLVDTDDKSVGTDTDQGAPCTSEETVDEA